MIVQLHPAPIAPRIGNQKAPGAAIQWYDLVEVLEGGEVAVYAEIEA